MGKQVIGATKHVQTILGIEHYTKLRIFSVSNDILLQDLLRHIIEEWIDKQPDKEVLNHGEEKVRKEN